MMTKRYFWSPKPAARGWYVKAVAVDVNGFDTERDWIVEEVGTKAEAIRRTAELNLEKQ